MTGDAATSAASHIKPSDEQLSQIDSAAEDNTWHPAPDLSKEALKKQAQGVYGSNLKKDIQDVAKAGTDAAGAHGSSGSKPAEGMAAVKAAARQKIDKNMDPETKEKIRQRNEEYRRKAKQYFKKKMPQDRKDQIVFRLKKMVLECQQHPDYTQAIQTLLGLAKTYGQHGRNMGEKTAETAKQARTGLSAAEHDLRTLIERFANGTSTSKLWESIGHIYKDAEKDDELKGWFSNMDKYINRCLLEQGYILEDASTAEWEGLYEKGRYLLREKYRGRTDRVMDETKALMEQFERDPQNKALGQAVQKLYNDLGHDKGGKPVFKKHLVKDMTDVILPTMMEKINYLPIPRIEYTDPQFDFAVENLVLESDNFMPNVIEAASDNYFRWGRKKIANKNRNTMDVRVAGIQMDLRDVSYHVKRKTGFPTITDTGVANILLPGNGLSFRMKVATADKSDRQNFFKVEKVKVDFKGLNIKLKQSNHKLLFAIVKPLVLKVLRPPIQKLVEKAIKDECNKLDGVLYEMKQEADSTAGAVGEDGKETTFYSRFYQAAQRRMLQKKEESQATNDDKKVNIAMTMEDSILPHVKLPGSVSAKASQYKQLAKSGDKWESPVFSLDDAQTNIVVMGAPRIEAGEHSTEFSPGSHAK